MDSRIAVPHTSSSDTDIIAHDLRGSSDSATSTASAPPAVSLTAIPRTSSSDTVADTWTVDPRTSPSNTDIIAGSDDLRGFSDPATSTASAPPAVLRTSSLDMARILGPRNGGSPDHGSLDHR